MSGVSIISPGAGAGGTPTFSYFADSFTRADQPWMIGTNWSVGINAGENFGVTGVQLAGLWNIGGGTDLVLQNAGGPAPCPTMYGLPVRINPGPVWGKKQFSEIVYISGTNAVGGFGSGPAVLFDANSFSGYSIEAINNGAAIQYRVDRWVNGAIGAVIIALTPFAYGDTLRLEVLPGAPNTVTVFKNGVQDTTTTDAGVASVGMPALFGSANVGNNVHFRNFKCGSLPQARTSADFAQ